MLNLLESKLECFVNLTAPNTAINSAFFCDLGTGTAPVCITSISRFYTESTTKCLLFRDIGIEESFIKSALKSCAPMNS